MNVGLRALRVFFCVARRGSFTRAAAELGLSQSGVSLSVRQLETELGVALFDRTTRQMSLTAAGEVLLANAARLVGELDGVLADLRDAARRRRGRVVMACVPTVAGSIMPRCLLRCARALPQVTLMVEDCSHVEVVRRVDAGEVEFGIVSGTMRGGNLLAEQLMADPFRLVCRRDDPLAASRLVPWAALAGRRLVMLNNTSGSRHLIESTLAAAAVDVQVVLELSQPSSILPMVEQGVGIAVVPALGAPRRNDPHLVTRRLVDPEVERAILLIRRRDRSLSPTAEAVWQVLLSMPHPVQAGRSQPRAG